MANLVKKISAPYLITSTSGNTVVGFGDGTLNNAQVTVNGKISVDNIFVSNSSAIVLNSNLASNVAPSANAAITVNRGSSNTASILWNEVVNRWQIDNGVVGPQSISTVTGTGLGAVLDDTSPALGGNLNVNGWTITSQFGNVIISPAETTQIDSAILLKEITGVGSNIAGYDLLFANVPAGGGSGLFVTNSAALEQELVTKKKAIVYSIIF